MDSSPNKSIGALLERLTSSDKDYRFMGMNDLINELQSDSLRLDSQSEKKVVTSVLRLLRDPNSEVQGLAVKSFGPLSSKLKGEQILTIVEELVNLLDTCYDDQLRGICGIGLKTVFSSVSNLADSSVTQQIIQKPLNNLLRMSLTHSDNNVRVESCEVLTEMINHFGVLLSSVNLELLDCMLCNLTSTQTAIRKRATQSVGCLAWTVPQDDLVALTVYLLTILRNASLFQTAEKAAILGQSDNEIIQKHPLFQRPKLVAQLETQVNVEVLKTFLQCLNLVAPQLNRVPTQMPTTLQLLDFILRRSDLPEEELCDLHELAIQILETLIRSCPHVILSTLPKLPSLLCEKLQYDPNYLDDEDEQMNVDGENGDDTNDDSEEEDEDYSDNEDASWKVRRASARALEAFVLSYPEKIPEFLVTVAPLLIKRFSDHEELVRSCVFSCFTTLLHQISLPHANWQTTTGQAQSTVNINVDWPSNASKLDLLLSDPESAQSKLAALVPSLCGAIHKQARVRSKSKPHSSSSSQGIQHAAFLLYRNLALALPGHLGSQLNMILSLMQMYTKGSLTQNTVKVDVLGLLTLLLRSHSPDCFMTNVDCLVKLAIWGMQDAFYRVALEALEVTQLLAVRLKMIGQGSCANQLMGPLLSVLEGTSRDLELKEKAIITSAIFLNYLGDLLEPHDVNKCLSLIQQRLKNEHTRLSAVRAVHIISISSSPLQLDSFLPSASDELATFLSQSDRNLRLTTLRCLYAVWSKHSELVGPTCLKTITSLISKSLISDQDLQLAQLVLHLVALLVELTKADPTGLGQHISRFVTSNEFMQPSIKLAHSPVLRGHVLEAMLRLMRAVGQFACQEKQGDLKITSFLRPLLAPVHGNGIISCQSAGPTSNLHRDSLPSLAQCVAQLLTELPLSTNSQPNSADELCSVDMVVDRLIAAIKNPQCPTTTVYMNLSILRELGRRCDLSKLADLTELLLACLSSSNEPAQSTDGDAAAPITMTDEIRPAAALALGRLVIQQPQTMIPFLLDRISELGQKREDGVGNQHQLYYMLQSLKEVLVNLTGTAVNEVLKAHVDAIWSLLVAKSGLPEEGTRNLVAECLGRLVTVSPAELVARLRQQLNSPEAASYPLVRSTMVTAIKYLLTPMDFNQYDSSATGQFRPENFDVTSGLLPSVPLTSTDPSHLNAPNASTLTGLDNLLCSGQPPLLIEFLYRLADPEVLVRRSALVVLNTAVHHRHAWVRTLLNLPFSNPPLISNETLLKLLYQQTIPRPELIREVEMGPFKHKEDDGLDSRKCAFECMCTLLEHCADKLTMSEFLDHLIVGMKDDNDDIKILCYQMIQQITHLRPIEICTKMKELSEALRKVLNTKPKDGAVKPVIEKLKEVHRCALAVVANFKSISDIDKQRSYSDLLRMVEFDNELKSMYREALSH